MNNSQSWLEIIGPWIVIFIVFTATLFVNVILATFVGIAIGWLFSLFFIGDWINEVLRAFGVSIIPGSLYKIGAVAGFLSGFFKYSFSFKRRHP
ncbi:MAG: hypothetical protein ABSA46_05500 [Thermodesulfovibrionales bacterium]|jgi:hypothetical protein